LKIPVPYYPIVPKTMRENMAHRQKCLRLRNRSRFEAEALVEMCRRDILFWLNTFVWMYDRERQITSALLPTWTDCYTLALRWLTWEPEQAADGCEQLPPAPATQQVSVSQLARAWAPVEQRLRRLVSEYEDSSAPQDEIVARAEALQPQVEQLQQLALAVYHAHEAAPIRVQADLDQIDAIYRNTVRARTAIDSMKAD